MNKISTKIITCIILCTMITSILLCSISIIQSRHLLLSNAKEKVTLLAKTKSINFDREMSVLENAVKNISFNVQASIKEKKIDGNDKYLAKFIKQIGPMVKNGASQIKGNVDAYAYLDPNLSKKNIAYQSVWILNGNTFKDAGELVPADKLDENDASMSWFFKPKKTKEGSWSSPYKDKFLKKELITYSTPIIQDGNFIGVVGMDIDFSIFKKIVNGVKIYKTGYAYLLNNNHNFLIHKKLDDKTNISKLQDKNDIDINKVMDKKKSGFSYITYKGTKKLLGFSRLDNGFIFCVSAPESEILSDANTLTAILMGLILLGFAIAVTAGIVMAKILVNPIYKVLNVMKLAEEGDLNCKAEVNSKDEIGKLANGFNNMVNGQKNIINKILTISNNTNETMNELMDSSEKVIASSSEVANSTQSIAISSNQQAEDASAISMNLEDFSDEINKIIIKTSVLENETAGIETMASSSKSQLKDMIDSIHSVYQFFNEGKTNIEALSQSIKEVSKITEVINGIAGQTNLLALNASIEAARSGEAGKGFAVVAQEIGNLAEKTGQSSGEINRLLDNLVEVVDKVVNKTETISIQFNNQEETVELSANSFNQIITAVNEMSPKIKEINDSTKLIGDNKTEILSRIQSLAAAAQEISASTEEVSSLTEEVDNVSKSISSQFGNLSEAFDKLNKEFERFKL